MEFTNAAVLNCVFFCCFSGEAPKVLVPSSRPSLRGITSPGGSTHEVSTTALFTFQIAMSHSDMTSILFAKYVGYIILFISLYFSQLQQRYNMATSGTLPLADNSRDLLLRYLG